MRGEFEIIGLFRDRAAKPGRAVVLGIGDDAAVVRRRRGELLVIACDTVADGVHTDLAYATPWDVGYKSLAVNVSDLAAMGAAPEYALVAAAFPADASDALVEGVAQGFADCARKYGVDLIGGDTTRSPSKLIVTVTVTGRAASRRLLRRDRARTGDEVFVTGPLGGSHAGLLLLKDWAARPPGRGSRAERIANLVKWGRELWPDCVERHLAPTARLGEGLFLAGAGVKCAIDVSDGLVSECGHVARESGVGVEIIEEDVPLATGVREVANARCLYAYDFAYSGGEDYELVYTVARSSAKRVADGVESLNGRRPARVGRVVSGSGVWIVARGKKRQPKTGGFSHF